MHKEKNFPFKSTELKYISKLSMLDNIERYFFIFSHIFTKYASVHIYNISFCELFLVYLQIIDTLRKNL